MATPLSAHVNVTALHEHGFLVVPRVISTELVARLHRQVMARLSLGFRQSSGIALVAGFGFVRKLLASRAIRAVADAVFAGAPEGYRACGPSRSPVKP